MAYSPSEVWKDGVLIERNRSTWDSHVRDSDDDTPSFIEDVEKPAKRVAKKAAKK